MRIRIQNPQCLLWFRYLILKVAKCTVDTGSCRFESGFVQIRKWDHADSKVGSCRFESGFMQIRKWVRADLKVGSCRFESGFMQIRKWDHADSKVGSFRFESGFMQIRKWVRANLKVHAGFVQILCSGSILATGMQRKTKRYQTFQKNNF